MNFEVVDELADMQTLFYDITFVSLCFIFFFAIAYLRWSPRKWQEKR